MIRVGHGIVIDDSEIQFRYVRARGPGGQHVNKASTAVRLTFDLEGSPSIPEGVKQRLRRDASSYLTSDGLILIFADRYRSQRRNKQDATDRLVDLIRRAATPVRSRRETRPPRAAIERRLEQKKRRGQRKRERKWSPDDES